MRIALLFVAALVVAVAACGGGGGPGALITTRDPGLQVYDIKRGSEDLLVPIPAEYPKLTSVADPALSPDGKRIAFVVIPPVAKARSGGPDVYTDIWVANRDGSGVEALYRHEDENRYTRFPEWLDATHILAILREYSPDGRTLIFTLQRIDVATGEKEQVLDNVLAYSLSRDRSRIVFSRIEAPGEIVKTAAPDGSGETAIMTAAEHKILNVGAMRFSPDGKRVAFMAANQPGASARAGLGAPAPHGLPQDLWVIDLATAAVERVAALNDDAVAIDWNGDGKRIYVLATNGFYDVSTDGSEPVRLGDGFLHGAVVWSKKR